MSSRNLIDHGEILRFSVGGEPDGEPVRHLATKPYPALTDRTHFERSSSKFR
jgi:hypothetical protein